MRYVQDSPLELGHRLWQLQPPRWSMTVVAKGTFELVPGGPAAFAEEPIGVTGERYLDDDVERPLRSPGDLALLKPCGEAMVVGDAHAGGAARPAISCRFAIGPIEKSFAVFGDREWSSGVVAAPSAPVPFERMPLDMTRAYGGPGFAANPFGRGRAATVGEDGQARVFLPNLEQPGRFVDARDATVDPVVVGPLPTTWPARMALAGTYDGAYARERWPWLPTDFDPRFFLEGPPDQRLAQGFFRGDERIELEGLHPVHAKLTARLPGVRPRVVVRHSRRGAEPVSEEVPLVLDTVVWDGEVARLLCVWRGRIEVESEELAEVETVYVAHDPLDGPHRPLEALAARCAAVLEAEEAEEAEAEGEDPPSIDEPLEEDGAEEAEADEAGDAEVGDAELGEEEEVEDPAMAAYAELERRLDALGIPRVGDVPAAQDRPSPRALLDALTASGAEVPEGLAELVAESEAAEAEAHADPENEELPEPEDDPLEGRALVESRLAEGLDLRELDLSGADLRGLDLSRQDLLGTVLEDANLEGVSLQQARLRGCVLVGAKLGRAVLAAADAGEADFTGADLRGADLVNANLEGADLTEASLVSVRLTGARAAGAILTQADLTGSVITRADLREADLEGARLDGVDVSESDLTDATLEDATAAGARFDGCAMVKLRAAGLRADEARFVGVLADDSFWEGAQLTRAVFTGARLARADFSGAALTGAQLDRCAMREARFDRASAHSMQARRADLFEASLEGADLRFADLRGASLFGANLFGANTDDANLELADLGRTLLAR